MLLRMARRMLAGGQACAAVHDACNDEPDTWHIRQYRRCSVPLSSVLETRNWRLESAGVARSGAVCQAVVEPEIYPKAITSILVTRTISSTVVIPLSTFVQPSSRISLIPCLRATASMSVADFR